MLFPKKGESEFDKRPLRVIIEAIICLIVISFLSFLAANNNYVYKNREDSNKRRCFSNIRMISGAVEMYNMDVSEMMVSLDLDILTKNGYLRKKAIDGLKCKFKTTGDLTKDGFVYCEYHGDPSGEIKGENLSIDVISKEDSQKQLKDKIFNCFLIALFVLALPILRILVAMCTPMEK